MHNCHLKDAKREDFEALPAHKTLFKAHYHCGLPIGNLTSQFFANVYLDGLDQEVKHHLKVGHYLRYCDDFILLSRDKAELVEYETHIAAFLSKEYRLKLNERRLLRPVSDGIDFLGYIVRPDYLLVRRRVAGALTERLAQTEKELISAGLRHHGQKGTVYPWKRPIIEKTCRWLCSYQAHFLKASSRKVVARLQSRFPWLAEYFLWNSETVRYTCPYPRPFFRLKRQLAWFFHYLPGHWMVVRCGSRWNLYSPRSIRRPLRKYSAKALSTVKHTLWRAGLPVAWIGETGRPITEIQERVLLCRWTGGANTDPLPHGCQA